METKKISKGKLYRALLIGFAVGFVLMKLGLYIHKNYHL